ncbi:hypothetical protein [Aquimarina brevivitae]|uniref:Adhesin n=1 Tax=Aquimarina brevivitae TaxID=323412 RepID=A0A4Q7NUP1_9FLAO|nr:hypothetical protein [Aquimarina brevivitae]RZS90650.1 hypothetical protein EV197_3179 [Aquimarina brevivitae]
MKTIYYKLFLALLIPLLSFAHPNDLKGKYNKEKSLKKEFSVNSDALLKIKNDYGNLDITSWDQNKIVIEVTIKVSGNDEEEVIEKLESIDVEFKSSTQMVSAITVFDQNKKSWWDKITGGSSRNLSMKINYKVKVPVTNAIDLNNNYGSITLDKIKGSSKINCDYGQLIIGELLSDTNDINIDYTNNSSIKVMKKGNINADYSDYEVGSSEYINLVADYTQSKLDNVKELNYNCDYGGLKLGNTGSINGVGDYVDIKINTVSDKLVLNTDYGSIIVHKLQPSVKEVIIDADYSGVELNVAPDFNFDFNLKASYGGINVDSDFTVKHKDTKGTSKEYKGYYGTENSGNSIIISSSYGGVKLHKN